MNGKMPTQDQLKLRLELHSNKGIESIRKTPIKNINSFTPSPLKKEAVHQGNLNSGSIDTISCINPVKQKGHYPNEYDKEDGIHNKKGDDCKSNYYDVNKASSNSGGIKKNSNFFEQLSANLDDLANLELNLNFNLKSNNNKIDDNKEKNSFESSLNNTNANLSLNQSKLNNNSIYNSVNKTSSNLANVNTTSNSNNPNNNNKIKDKEKAEEAAPLTSNLKNFLENYDDLLGMIGSNSKSSTMTSNFSNENNNNNHIYTSILDNGSILKQDPKSKTTKFPQAINYPPNFSAFTNDEENSNNGKKFKFASSFKNKNSAEITAAKFKSRRSTGNCFQTCSLSLKKTISDVTVPQTTIRSKDLESNILRLNLINPIIEDVKNDNNNQSDNEGIFRIIPKTNSDDENENNSDADNADNVACEGNSLSDPEQKTVLFYESQGTDSKENNMESLITLTPTIPNIIIKESNVHLDSLVTSQVRKPNPQGTQVEDRNIEETKIVQNLTNQEDIKDFYEYTEECLKRIIKLKTPTIEEIQDLLFNLPFEEELKAKKLAIFDLDETLIHCEIKKPQKGQVQIMVNLPSGDTAKIGLNIRPFWRECLQELSKFYLIIVYTASHQSYADSVLDYLDPDKELIKYRLYRHNCVRVKMESEFIYVKDLRIFKNVRMEDMIIIDNSVLSFAFQLENGIPILPFYDNKEDIELKFLANYLGNIYNVSDLRFENNRSIKMLYFLNAVKEKEKSEEEKDSNKSNFNINLINSNNSNEEENNSSFVSDPEGFNSSEGKKDPMTMNSDSMFKISLFSVEGNNNRNNVNSNQNDVSQMSDNNEASFSNSESSHNDSYNLNNNSGDITNKFFNFNSNNYNNNVSNLRISEGNNSVDININKNKNWENMNTEGNSDSNGKRVNKRNNTFQENLFSTLDDLKKTFTKLSEKKRTSCLFNHNNI